MPNRYRRITGSELASGLDIAGLTLDQFCRIYGVRPRRATRWLNDEDEIPHGVAVLLGLVEDPAVLAKAEVITDHLLIEQEDS